MQTGASLIVSYRLRHLDRHYVWFETTLRVMTGATGELTADVLCASRDIGDRKRMEERLHGSPLTMRFPLIHNNGG